MVKQKTDILASRRKADADNWAAAQIYLSDTVRYAGVYQEWAAMIIAKGKPAGKRGEQQALIEPETNAKALNLPVVQSGGATGQANFGTGLPASRNAGNRYSIPHRKSDYAVSSGLQLASAKETDR